MENFDIAKYLKENKLGPHAILSNYVDLQPLKEMDEKDMYDTVPYEGPEHKLDGRGGEFKQAHTVSEDMYGPGTEQDAFNRMMGLIDASLEYKLPKIKQIIDSARELGLSDKAIFQMLCTSSVTGPSCQALIGDGFEAQDIVDFFTTDFSLEDMEEEVTVSSSGVEMEEAMEGENNYGTFYLETPNGDAETEVTILGLSNWDPAKKVATVEVEYDTKRKTGFRSRYGLDSGIIDIQVPMDARNSVNIGLDPFIATPNFKKAVAQLIES